MDILSILTIVISFVSLIISLFVLFRDCWKERFNIECEKIKWFASMVNNQPFYIWMNISNKSKLPVSIIKMELVCNRNGKLNTAISRGEGHLVMSKKKDGTIKEKYSCDYPICIDGYASYGAYFHFVSNAGHYSFEEQDVTVKVYTNRGVKEQKMHLDYGSNIFRVLQALSKENVILYNSEGSSIEYQYDGV